MTSSMAQFLHLHPLLHGVPLHEIEDVTKRMNIISFDPGEQIMREGDIGQDCLFIVEGIAHVYTRNLIGKPILLAELGPNNIIGEIALLMNERRSANIRAHTNVLAIQMRRDVFEQLLNVSSLFHESMKQSAEIRHVHRLLRKASIWSAIPESELRGLAEITVRRKVRKADVIIREGEGAESLFMITSGRFEVRSNGKLKALLGEGDSINEISLLTDLKATETVTAIEDGEVLMIGKTEFSFVLLQYPPVLRQFAQMLHIRRPDLSLSYTLNAAMEEHEKESVSRESKQSMLEKDIFAGRWFEMLLGMGFLFLVFTLLSIFQGHLIWKYAALFTGAIIGPVTFVAYMRHSQLLGFRPTRLIKTLLLSALVAIPVAWILQNLLLYSDLRLLSISGLRIPLTVAIIEETAKLLFCLVLFRTKQLRFLMDAVVFGAAAGMGFAAIETILYGWSQLVSDSTGGMLAVIWGRALLSPFGHGTWTAIALAGLWYMKNRKLSLSKPNVIKGAGLLLVAVGLHTLWNLRFAEGLWHILIMIIVGVFGLLILSLLIKKGREQEHQVLVMINPAIDEYDMEVEEEKIANNRSSEIYLLCESCETQSPSHARYCARCGQSLRLTRRNT